MSKLRVMMAALLVATLFLLPIVAQAQPSVTNFYGNVTLDGVAVADGTVVKAWINGVEAGSTTTSGASYQISINGEGQDPSFDGETVTFTVGSDDAQVAESGTFTKGAQKLLNLTAASIPPTKEDISITLAPSEGTATNVIGEGAAFNNPVYIYFGDELYTTVSADGEGKFNAVIIPPTNVAADYDITAIDVLERSATETFKLTLPTAGDDGTIECNCPPGETGPEGPAGQDGEDGDDGSSTMGIVALIIAIIAIILAIVFRVMKPAGATEG